MRALRLVQWLLLFYTSGIGVGVEGVPIPLYFSSIIFRMSFKGVPFSNSDLASRAMSTQTPQPKPIVSRVAVLPSTWSTKQFVLLVWPSSS